MIKKKGDTTKRRTPSKAEAREAHRLSVSIKRRLLLHLRELGFQRTVDDRLDPPSESKGIFRSLHRKQRFQRLREERPFIKQALPRLQRYFASGSEVRPASIVPRLEVIPAECENSDLFRLASLTWSVPVSMGYGRRIRFLVWDDYTGRLMGLIALGDPVFNSRPRDTDVGWGVSDRRERLVDVMDAFVLGALPPYNLLLGGKLVASLIRTKEVRDEFRTKYAHSTGIISKRRKNPSLVMVTTSSALGRSAVYDRLVLNGVRYFEPVGYSEGWGHFQVPDRLFNDMRRYLALIGHPYSSAHEFGEGPNWRLRTVRAALEDIGLEGNLLRHGIKREVFVCRLASNADNILTGRASRPIYSNLLNVDEVAALAIERWVIRRSKTRPDYARWQRSSIAALLKPDGEPTLSLSAGGALQEATTRNLESGSIASRPTRSAGPQLGRNVVPTGQPQPPLAR